MKGYSFAELVKLAESTLPRNGGTMTGNLNIKRAGVTLTLDTTGDTGEAQVSWARDGLVNYKAIIDRDDKWCLTAYNATGEYSGHVLGVTRATRVVTFDQNPLIYSAQSTAVNAATRRDYVNAEDAKKLNLAGGTLTGVLTAPGIVCTKVPAAAGDMVNLEFLDAQTPSRATVLPNVEHDLNTYLNSGFYTQPANVGAAAGKNYPVPYAGALVLTKAAGIVQEYTVYNTGRRYIRTYYSPSWSAWQEIYSTGRKPSAAELGVIPLNGGATATGGYNFKHSANALSMQSASPGVAQVCALHGRDSDGAGRWYVGQGNANDPNVVLHNYTLNTTLHLQGNRVLATRPLHDNTGVVFTPGRPPSAAAGNSDIVAGGLAQVGTYAMLGRFDAGGAIKAGAVVSGSLLDYTNADGSKHAGKPPGNWKCLGWVKGDRDFGPWNVSLFIRVS
jgi:hypothetical protein